MKPNALLLPALALFLAHAPSAFAQPMTSCEPGSPDSLAGICETLMSLPGHVRLELNHFGSSWSGMDQSFQHTRSTRSAAAPAPTIPLELDGCRYEYPRPQPVLNDGPGPAFTISSGATSVPASSFVFAKPSLTPGATYDLTWPAGTGPDAIPPPDAPLSIAMPESFKVTSPDLSHVSYNSGPLDVAWTGGTGTGEIEIRISYDRAVDPYDIVCRATDDGSFTIANGLSVGPGKLTLTRRNETGTVLSDGTTVSAGTSWSESGTFWGTF